MSEVEVRKGVKRGRRQRSEANPTRPVVGEGETVGNLPLLARVDVAHGSF